jgi:hypothetical protein
MEKILSTTLFLSLLILGCKSDRDSPWTETEKNAVRLEIQKNIDEGLKATRSKDIEGYMKRLPKELVIYDESGEIISREKQREYVLRDWAIIDTTLAIRMDIDSIHFLKRDSLHVFTSQRWERMMFQRDGITRDTVLTTQRHRETWKKVNHEWFEFYVEELGGKIFINGEAYDPN